MTSDGGTPGDCSRVVALLADYLDNQLPRTIHAELSRHLHACERCEHQLQTYRTTVSLLRGLRDDELPADLRQSLEDFMASRAH